MHGLRCRAKDNEGAHEANEGTNPAADACNLTRCYYRLAHSMEAGSCQQNATALRNKVERKVLLCGPS
jgi:hypothetical protein